MIIPRIIPCLLLRGKGLVKGVRFRNHQYIGDPINTVQLFNTKEVDEIVFLDITATKERRIPSTDLIQSVANECLVPFSVGGGIRSIEDIRTILRAGAEKVCLNTHAFENPEFVRAAAQKFGRQSIVVSVDLRKNVFGKYHVFTRCGRKKIRGDVVGLTKKMEELGAGEILLNFIDRDGTVSGYPIEMIQQVRRKIGIPLIALGGAGTFEHLRRGIAEGGADAVAAGTMFVLHGRRRAVLISYPNKEALARIRGE